MGFGAGVGGVVFAEAGVSVAPGTAVDPGETSPVEAGCDVSPDRDASEVTRGVSVPLPAPAAPEAPARESVWPGAGVFPAAGSPEPRRQGGVSVQLPATLRPPRGRRAGQPLRRYVFPVLWAEVFPVPPVGVRAAGLLVVEMENRRRSAGVAWHSEEPPCGRMLALATATKIPMKTRKEARGAIPISFHKDPGSGGSARRR